MRYGSEVAPGGSKNRDDQVGETLRILVLLRGSPLPASAWVYDRGSWYFGWVLPALRVDSVTGTIEENEASRWKRLDVEIQPVDT